MTRCSADSARVRGVQSALVVLSPSDTVLYVAASGDGELAAIASDADGELTLVRPRRDGLSRTSWPHRDVQRLAFVGAALFAQVGQRVVRVDDEGRAHRISEGLAFAPSAHGLVIAVDGGLTLHPSDGPARELVQYGAFPREVELVERSGARTLVTIDAQGRYLRGEQRHQTSLGGLFGTASCTAMAAVAAGVGFVTVGGPHALPELRFVAWEGGLPAVLVREPDDGGRSRWLGPVAACGAQLAVLTGLATQGSRVSSELWLLSPHDARPRKIPVESRAPRGLFAAGETVALLRAAERAGAVDVLEGDRWRQLADDVTSVDIASTKGAVVLGRRNELVAVPWAAVDDAPSPTVATLLAAIRAAGGAFEKTSVGGKPAIKITRPDGSRQIKPLSADDLRDLERRLG